MSVSYANIIQLFMTTKETSTKKTGIHIADSCFSKYGYDSYFLSFEHL